MSLKQFVKPLVPRWLLERRRMRIARRIDESFKGRPPEQVFSEIYARGMWGRGADGALASGEGSHRSAITGPYVEAVRAFLKQFPRPADVVDLGCGDFAVGSRIRDLCGRYIACDVVPAVIAQNCKAFADSDVEFRQIDIVADALPPGGVAFIRQVLQHLSNAQIAAVAAKLPAYRTVIVTEHLSPSAKLAPNLDKPAGPGTRLSSGVILTAPPFSLKPRRATVLCTVPVDDGVIETIAYEFEPESIDEHP